MSAARRALLLAAGLGERLRPLTLKIPKCLLPVAGRPVMDLWLEACRRARVDEVLVNTHHLADQVCDHLAGRTGLPAVRTSHEETLLGSAGTLASNRSVFDRGGPFAIIYADTLAPRLDLDAMFAWHERRGAILTMGLFRTRWPRECGIARADDDGRILSFEEKPAHPSSDLANAGVLIAEPEVLDELPRTLPSDLSRDFLPSLAGRMVGYLIEGPVLDIGTPARYREAQAVATGREAWSGNGGVGNRPQADTL